MKNKNLGIFDWCLQVCATVIILAALADALNRFVFDFLPSPIPVVQGTQDNAAMGLYARPALVM